MTEAIEIAIAHGLPNSAIMQAHDITYCQLVALRDAMLADPPPYRRPARVGLDLVAVDMLVEEGVRLHLTRRERMVAIARLYARGRAAPEIAERIGMSRDAVNAALGRRARAAARREDAA